MLPVAIMVPFTLTWRLGDPLPGEDARARGEDSDGANEGNGVDE